MESLKVKAKDLSEIFEPNIIGEGKSSELLDSRGGIDAIIENLDTSKTQGIASASVPLRRRLFGKNSSSKTPKPSYFKILCHHLSNSIMQILIAAAIISLVTGLAFHPDSGWYEGALLFALILVVVNLATITDYINEKQFRTMSKEYASAAVIVIRDGFEVEVPLKDVVVGDLMFLMSGGSIEVDGILVRGFGVTVNEKDITGIEFPVRKSTSSPFILAGSTVVDGSGLIVVCAVGKHSNLARKRKALQEEPVQFSPLQTNLHSLVLLLGKIGLVSSVFLFLVLLIYILIDEVNDFLETFFVNFILSLTLLIISVPEGLPIALTVTILKVTNELKNHNCFIRNSRACEMLGSVDTVLIDKKGILTSMNMQIKYTWLGGVYSQATNHSNIPESTKALVAETLARNSIATEDLCTGKFTGNQTECCLLNMIKDWGYIVSAIRCPNKHIAQIPISVQDNKSTTFYLEDSVVKIYSKGNDSLILSKCSHILTETGEVEALTHDRRRDILKSVKDMISNALVQTISISFKNIDASEFYVKESYIENINEYDTDMIYLGTIVMADQVNPQSYMNVLNLLKASTRVIMVTSDDRETAQYVAESTRIVKKALNYHHYTMMSADALRNKVGYSQNSIECLPLFTDIMSKLSVLHSASHEDKLMLVNGLKETGRVVVMTGESINDSQALKASDVGIALKISNMLVKENSDIILLEDSIASVENSIRFGRHINQTMLRFIKYQLTLTFVTILVVIISTISIWDVPLAAIQILVVTIILDAAAAIVVSLEPATTEYTHEPPMQRDKMLKSEFITILTVQTVFQTVSLLVVLWLVPYMSDVDPGWNREQFGDEETEHYTIFFAVYAFMSLYNMFNVRKLYSFEWNVFKDISKNKTFFVLWMVIFVMIVLIIELGGTLFHTAASSAMLYVSANLLGVMTLVVEFVSKLLLVRRQKKPENSSETKWLLSTSHQ